MTEHLYSSFAEFLDHYFPEHREISREEALVQIDDRNRGMLSKNTDAAMVEYQNDVASIYGSYERRDYHLKTLERLLCTLPLIGHTSDTLLSLGCGPASFELFLLQQGAFENVILVDYSPAMISRARLIASDLNLTSQVTFHVCDGADTCRLVDQDSAAVVWSINAMHWTSRWGMWLSTMLRACRPGGSAFVSFTNGFFRTGITVKEVRRRFQKIFELRESGLVIDPFMEDGNLLAPQRYFLSGTKNRHRRKSSPRNKRSR